MVAEFLDHNIWSLTDDKIENNENGEKTTEKQLCKCITLLYIS